MMIVESGWQRLSMLKINDFKRRRPWILWEDVMLRRPPVMTGIRQKKKRTVQGRIGLLLLYQLRRDSAWHFFFLWDYCHLYNEKTDSNYRIM